MRERVEDKIINRGKNDEGLARVTERSRSRLQKPSLVDEEGFNQKPAVVEKGMNHIKREMIRETGVTMGNEAPFDL